MEMGELLLDRSYRPAMVDAAISKARANPKTKALKYVSGKKRIPDCLATFEP